MPTTTLRMDDPMKARIADAARRAGKSPHGFMLDAIAATLAQAEQDDALRRLAEERWAALAGGGDSVGWDEAKGWLEARAHGATPPRPLARKLAP